MKPRSILAAGLFSLVLRKGSITMIVQLKANVRKEQVNQLILWFRGMGVDVHVSEGSPRRYSGSSAIRRGLIST